MNRLIIVPLIGAIIGYVTNWIAVKMLFHPRKAIYIGKWKVPFTPGVIPKGQPRLARAIGGMVERQLLTEDILLGQLTSSSVEAHIQAHVRDAMDVYKRDSDTVKDKLLAHISEYKYKSTVTDIENDVAIRVHNRVIEMDIGSIVTEKVVESAKEKISNSFIGMMIGDSADTMIDSIAQQAQEKINQYIENEGYSYIIDKVWEESQRLQNKQVCEGFLWLEEKEIALDEIFIDIYHKAITKNIHNILSLLNLSGLVEQKINAMAVEEVEELVLVMMKQELGAIVNLGALIGFVLGLINVGVMLI